MAGEYKLPPISFATDCYIKVSGRPELAYEGKLTIALYVAMMYINANLDFQMYRLDIEQVVLTHNKFGLDTSEEIELGLAGINEIYKAGIDKGSQEVQAYFNSISKFVEAEERLSAGFNVLTPELESNLRAYLGVTPAEAIAEIDTFNARQNMSSEPLVEEIPAVLSSSSLENDPQVSSVGSTVESAAGTQGSDSVPSGRGRRDRRHRS
jgi:hypothetical protein